MTLRQIPIAAARWGAFLLLPALFAVPAAGAPATAGVPVRISMPATVTGGETIEVRWDSRAFQADEVELVLSLDGGRHFTLHVSPEMDPTTERYVWRVPNLAAGQAVLGLRLGRGPAERLWSVSAPFRIGADPALPGGYFVLHEGTPWCAAQDPAARRSSREMAGVQSDYGSGRETVGVPPRSHATAGAVVRAFTGAIPAAVEPYRVPRCAPVPVREFPLRN